MRNLALHWQILIGIALAGVAGLLTGADGQVFGINMYEWYDFMGTLFLNALKMLIVPLITSSIITGVAGIGGDDNLGRLGGKTILFYATSSLLAILVGLALVNMTSPGLKDGKPVGEQMNLSVEAGEVADMLERVEKGRQETKVTDIFLRMVPVNIVRAAGEGQMLGLIFFSLLFGFFMTRLPDPLQDPLKAFWQGVFEVMMYITMWVMKFAPYGVFGLVAKTVSATGFDAFVPLMIFFVTVVMALTIHVFVTLSVLLRVVGGVSPFKHMKAMAKAMLMAFSTASSSATLPLTLETVEKDVGVSNRTTSFVLPLGATVNMDGTALYECVAAMFIAQAYGLELTITQQFAVVLTALLTSIGVAGIPAASLVAISIILGVIGLPLEGIGLLLVTDRILDMLRTAVNVYSDSCGAVIIARTEGEITHVAAKE